MRSKKRKVKVPFTQLPLPGFQYEPVVRMIAVNVDGPFNDTAYVAELQSELEKIEPCQIKKMK